jgi:hypothetical protein
MTPRRVIARDRIVVRFGEEGELISSPFGNITHMNMNSKRNSRGIAKNFPNLAIAMLIGSITKTSGDTC